MQTVLLDFSRAWGNSQAHLLELALALHAEGRYHAHICCPRNSPLARKAREHSLPLLALWGESASNPLNLLRLWLLTRPSARCLIHTFSPAAAVAGARLLRLRPLHGSLLVHNVGPSFFANTAKTNNGKTNNGKEHDALPKHWLQAHKILCGNQQERTLLLKAGLSERQIVCLPAGVDTQALSAMRQHAIAEAAKGGEKDVNSPPRCIIASITGRNDSSAHSVLLKAMAALWQREDLPPWEIRIIGPCPNFQALLDEATALGVQSRLALLNEQPLTDTLPLCHAVVAPALSPQGSLPVMAAAWALGLPLLCPALPTNQEWATSEENALLYSAEDPQQLAACLKRLMHDPQLCRRLSEGGLGSLAATSIASAVAHCRALYAAILHENGWVLPPASPPVENVADKASPESMGQSAGQPVEGAEAVSEKPSSLGQS